MIEAPTSTRSSGWSAFTVAFVPTGMNWGVSTTPCSSSRRPSRARVEASAGPGVRTRNREAPLIRLPGSPRSADLARPIGADARLPQARHVRIGPAWRRDLVAECREMLPGGLGGDATLRRPVEEREAEEERLVHVLDRLHLLREHGRERLHADRAGSELLDDRGEELPIRRVEALVVDLHHPHRLVDDLAIDAATAVDLGMVADPLEQAIDDARRAPATAGDLARGVPLDRDAEDAGRAVDDRGEVVLVVEVEPVRRPEA